MEVYPHFGDKPPKKRSTMYGNLFPSDNFEIPDDVRAAETRPMIDHINGRNRRIAGVMAEREVFGDTVRCVRRTA